MMRIKRVGRDTLPRVRLVMDAQERIPPVIAKEPQATAAISPRESERCIVGIGLATTYFRFQTPNQNWELHCAHFQMGVQDAGAFSR